MITIIGSLIGFAASLFPEVFKLIQNKRDLAHELAILDRQLEAQKLGHKQRIEEISIQTDSDRLAAAYTFANESSGVRWIEGLTRSVRPFITYGFFALFAIIKLTVLQLAISQGVDPATALVSLWDEETAGIFSAIIAFWFGSRVYEKRNK